MSSRLLIPRNRRVRELCQRRTTSISDTSLAEILRGLFAGIQIAARVKNKLKRSMAPDQIAKGQELESEYWEKYVVPFQKD